MSQSQTAYAKVEAFLPHLDELQQFIMALEADENVGRGCASCQMPGAANYRCCECFNASPICATCIVKQHQSHPLHRIQKWTGTFFDAHTLRELGLIMYLGHHRTPCRASFDTKELVFIHTNGIHRCLVQFCACRDAAANFQQLVLLRLFPATLKFPATVFTFDLLSTFHQLTLCSKITPYDYFDTLKKLTNNAFPQGVEVMFESRVS